mgnify:CR=1 FL=1
MFLLERDALNGKEGKAFMTLNGRNIEMFSLKKFQSDAEFQESDFKVVGTRLVQKKATGVSLTGYDDDLLWNSSFPENSSGVI